MKKFLAILLALTLCMSVVAFAEPGIEATDANTLRCRLALSEAATCKPELLMDALSTYAGLAERPRTITTRLQMYGKDFIPLELL